MRRLLVIAYTLLVSLALQAQGIPLCKESPFRAGESIDMGLMFKLGAVNTEVGRARLELAAVPYGADSTRVDHAACVVRSAPFFDVFFKMREHFQTWFTLESHRPLEAIRDTYENGYTAANHFIYDWPRNVIRADVSYRGGPAEHKEIPMKGMSYDIVSLIYYLRKLDWNKADVGKPVIVPFAIDDTVFEVKVTCWGPEVFKVRRLGKYNALRFSCTVVAGALFAGDQEIQVWFSNDENHLPLAVMVPLKMGTMWGWLKSWNK